MLAEFLQKLTELTERAYKPVVVKEHGLRRRMLLAANGAVQSYDLPAPDRAHKLVGLDDLIAAINDKAICPAPEVYHYGACVDVLLDREERDQRVSMALRLSERFSILMQMRTAVGLEPKAAIRFLRQSLGDSAPVHVITALRQIDFTRTSAGKSHVEHGKESLGRSVEAAVQQADKVPEDFVVRVPVYTNPGAGAFLVEVRVMLYLDLEGQQVVLQTMPDELEKAHQVAQARLHEALVANCPKGTPVFYGQA